MLLQATCEVQSDDTAQSLASRIHSLEHTYYKIVVEQYILQSV
jgi:phosphoribosylglycinamide formyltransferase-1